MAIPVRALNEYVYCPRLFHLERVEQVFEESADTVAGSAEHARAEMRRHTRPGGEDAPKNLYLEDPDHGIVGKFDAVRSENGEWVPVEAKHGHPPRERGTFVVGGVELELDVWPTDAIQLCAEGLLLRANGYKSTHGYVSYRAARRRFDVLFSDRLVEATLRVVREAETVEAGPLPPPLVDSPKCLGCSLNALCMPDETNLLRGADGSPPRRIVPGREDGGVLYLTEQGAQLGVTGELLEIRKNGEIIDRIPAAHVAHVAVFGNVQVTAGALRVLLDRDATISHFTHGGYFVGVTQPFSLRNFLTRRAQLDAAEDPERARTVARAIVAAKIANQRTLLRRNSKAKQAVEDLQALQRKAERAADSDELLGIEGAASRLYFETFPHMLKGDLAFLPEGRNRRPPRDPVNALLSFGYALLAREFAAACVTVGLEPTIGFYHAPRAGRPALALDLMEAYRPLVVDSMVLRLVNTGQIRPGHFIVDAGSCLLTPEGRRTVLAAYETRMAEHVTHPLFAYRISYRRAVELEARMLARYLDGDVPAYLPMRTR